MWDPPHQISMDDVKLVHFHNFESLATTKGEMVESPEFECAGHKWKLQLYPGGHDESEDDEIAVALVCAIQSSECFRADYCINVNKADARNLHNQRLHPYSDSIFMLSFSAKDQERLDLRVVSRSELLEDKISLYK
jgi:hypothetical protein